MHVTCIICRFDIHEFENLWLVVKPPAPLWGACLSPSEREQNCMCDFSFWLKTGSEHFRPSHSLRRAKEAVSGCMLLFRPSKYPLDATKVQLQLCSEALEALKSKHQQFLTSAGMTGTESPRVIRAYCKNMNFHLHSTYICNIFPETMKQEVHVA